jgi:protein-disulfide isomerase
MQITLPYRRALAASLLPMLLGLPLPSAAATPNAQTVLNLALLKEWGGQPVRQDIAVAVTVKQTAYRSSDPSGSAKLSLHLSTRTVPTGAALADQEGSISLDSVSVDPSLSEGMPVSLDGPLGIQWKLVDRTAYFQVSQIPPSLLQLAKDFSDMDYSALIGRWIKLDLGDAGKLPPDADFAAVKTLAMKAPPLLVTRLESSSKASNGDDLWRLRLRVNPAFVNGLYLIGWNKLPKSLLAERAAAIKTLNTDFANMRNLLAHTGIIAMVDATNQSLVRYELGGRYVSPVKTCAFNAAFRNVCRVSGQRIVSVAVGVNVSHDDGSPIIPPADALDQAGLEALLQSLQSNTSTVQDVTGTQTLSASTTLATVDPAVDHITGAADGKVTVITYADFECPFCQRMDPDLKHLLLDFPNDVRLVFRQYPLIAIHPEAQADAEASECAASLGGNAAFWGMHDKLMDNPALQNRDGYLAFVDQLSLDHNAFVTCIDTHAQASRVQRDLASGATAGVQGTPTTFVNGTRLDGAVDYSMLKDAVVNAGGLR